MLRRLGPPLGLLLAVGCSDGHDPPRVLAASDRDATLDARGTDAANDATRADAGVPDSGRSDARPPDASPTGSDASAPGDGAVADARGTVDVDASPSLDHRGAPYPSVVAPTENAPSSAKELLGKILFWEEQLSSDDTVACGTCHRAGAGGSDPRASEAVSRHPGADGVIGTPDDPHGARGVARCRLTVADGGTVLTRVDDPIFGLGVQVTRRKPPSYLDAMFSPVLFWDGRAASAFTDPDTGAVVIAAGGALESQSVGPPLSDAEMACEDRAWPDIHAKLASVTPLALARDVPGDMAAFITANSGSYPKMFAAAFGASDKVSPADPDDVINTRRIAFALATHERRLTSDQTPWDRWNAGDDSALTPAERAGFDVFMTTGRCNVCHAPPLFTDHAFHALGFVTAWDTGRKEVTSLTEDRGRFRTPTLRNVGLREAGGLLHQGTGPGATLDSVVAAYDLPPNADTSVDPEVRLLGLSGEETANLVEFLRHALTDPRVEGEASPFDRPKLGSEP